MQVLFPKQQNWPHTHPLTQACGFYPAIGRLLPNSTRDIKGKAQVLTKRDERVRVHMSSVNSR